MTLNSKDSELQWPQPIEGPGIAALLDPIKGTVADESILSNTARENVLAAHRKIMESGGNPLKDIYIVECDASGQRSRAIPHLSPCITRSRNHGHWITDLRRRMNHEEMLRLQGMNPINHKLSVTRAELGKQIGNAMSVNVLERLLFQIFKITTFQKRCHISELCPADRWFTGEALRELMDTRSYQMPDPVKGARADAAVPSAMATGSSNFSIEGETKHGTTRKMMLDSDASEHMIGKTMLTFAERLTIRPREPIRLRTAADPVWTSEEIDLWIPQLKLKVAALVLPTCPPIISMGSLVHNTIFQC